MKVFGIGLLKTGTTTLGSCLVQLGFNHCSYSRRAIWSLRRNNTDKLIGMMDKFDSFDDQPWPHFYQEIDKIYPDAKFILTVRRCPQAWYNSYCKHCDRLPYNEHRMHFYQTLLPRAHETELLSIYNNHNAEVIEYFKGREDKLLVLSWEQGDGWKELGSFLNVTVPHSSIPKDNEAPSRAYPALTYGRIISYLPQFYYNLVLRNYIQPLINRVVRAKKKHWMLF